MGKSSTRGSWLPNRVISGGQTGVDRAALEAAIACKLEHGGWCPKGRRAEDGSIAERYHLTETDSSSYANRTEKNVLEADATLILCRGRLRGGTRLTRQLAKSHQKPHLVVDLDDRSARANCRTWLNAQRPATLNVAGPRESQSPGIAAAAQALLEGLFRGE